MQQKTIKNSEKREEEEEEYDCPRIRLKHIVCLGRVSRHVVPGIQACCEGYPGMFCRICGHALLNI